MSQFAMSLSHVNSKFSTAFLQFLHAILER